MKCYLGLQLIFCACLCLAFGVGCDKDGETNDKGANDSVTDDDGAGSDADMDHNPHTDTDTDTADTDTDTDMDTEEQQQCIMGNCIAEISTCMTDAECNGWMTCVQECDDSFVCPRFCGIYFVSPLSSEFTNCAVDAGCLSTEFEDFDPCEEPSTELLDLSGMGGTWWFSASSGEDHLFAYDCQKFVFEELSATQLNVDFSVPLTYNDVEKMCGTIGTFEQVDDGSVKVIYDNYAAYHEDWYIVYKSANTLLAYLCFSGTDLSKDYGTLLLSRIPLADLEQAERDALNSAAITHFGVGLDGLVPIQMEGCTNK